MSIKGFTLENSKWTTQIRPLSPSINLCLECHCGAQVESVMPLLSSIYTNLRTSEGQLASAYLVVFWCPSLAILVSPQSLLTGARWALGFLHSYRSLLRQPCLRLSLFRRSPTPLWGRGHWGSSQAHLPRCLPHSQTNHCSNVVLDKDLLPYSFHLPGYTECSECSLPSQPPGFWSRKCEDTGHFSKTDCKLVTPSPDLLLAMSWSALSFLSEFMVYSSHSTLLRKKLHGVYIPFLTLDLSGQIM